MLDPQFYRSACIKVVPQLIYFITLSMLPLTLFAQEVNDPRPSRTTMERLHDHSHQHHDHRLSSQDTPYNQQRNNQNLDKRQSRPSASRTSQRGNLIAVLKVVVKDILTSTEDQQELPGEFSVEGSYPNPFRSTTRITYHLPEPAEVHAEVFDILGRLIHTSQVQSDAAGWNRTLLLDFPAASSGLYIYRVNVKTVSGTLSKTGRTIRIH
ncbi:MAG: T9SS type A sorting domain-containing protein [Bacteroidetes bacterium]|nr:T9SS type A sorting domain-containing protein [Bacteroidota bacterium]MCY4234448.1 T9SS type A sorting domain-containing protein [Bacteroidota bacterium]